MPNVWNSIGPIREGQKGGGYVNSFMDFFCWRAWEEGISQKKHLNQGYHWTLNNTMKDDW